MRVNKEHPKYKEYIKKCEDLAERQRKETAAIPPSGGQDGPLEGVYRKYLKELETLKREYSYLFMED